MSRALMLSLAVSLAGLAPGAWADEEAATVLEEWAESFQLGEKVEWEHRRITVAGEGADRRHVVETRSWRPWKGGTITRRSRFVSDAEGRILEGERSWDGGPLGERRWTYVAREGGGLTWTRRAAGGDEQTGTIEGEVLDQVILDLRLARGDLAPGTHEVRILAGHQAQERVLRSEVDEETGRVVVVRTKYRTEYEPDGRLVRSEHLERPGSVDLPASADEARERSRRRPPPEVEGVEDGAVVGRGFRLARPGPGWTLHRKVEGEKRMAGAELGRAMALLVLELPFAPPSDPEARRRFGESFARNVNAKDDLQLSGAAPADFRGRRALRFDVGGEKDLDEVAGEAWMVAAARGGLFVVAVRVVDTDEEGAAQLERALERLELVDAEEEQPPATRRVTLKQVGVSFEVPAAWKRSEEEGGVVFKAPGEVVQFGAHRVEGVAGTRDVIAQRLAAQQRAALEEPSVSVGEVELAGWPCAKVTAAGAARDPAASGLSASIVYWVFERPGGVYVLLTGVTLTGAADDGAVGRISESVQWLE